MGWTPDRSRKPAPPGWQYWRQPGADEARIARAKLTTRSDRLFQLNEVGRLMRMHAEHLPTVASPQVQGRIAALPWAGARRKLRKGVEGAYAEANEAFAATRDTLLFLVRHDLPANDAAVGWLQVLEPRVLNALAWSKHALGLAPSESREERQLRLLNSLPYGAAALTSTGPATPSTSR